MLKGLSPIVSLVFFIIILVVFVVFILSLLFCCMTRACLLRCAIGLLISLWHCSLIQSWRLSRGLLALLVFVIFFVVVFIVFVARLTIRWVSLWTGLLDAALAAGIFHTIVGRHKFLLFQAYTLEVGTLIEVNDASFELLQHQILLVFPINTEEET